MHFVEARTGVRMPVLGQGTWKMGERVDERAREVAALQLGFDLGMTLVDTAELYADGAAEEIVGQAIRGRRDAVFVVTKVLPGNASRQGTIRAAERSLVRLGIDCIDLYLLHWINGAHPIAETLHGFATLREQGKIRHFGVSNFDIDDMIGLEATANAESVCANQVYYTLSKRGIERNVLPWCQERQIAIMAYSPLEQGNIVEHGTLHRIATARGVSVQHVALAWTLRQTGVVTVVKASNQKHVRANAAARDWTLTDEELGAIDAAFPRPSHDIPLVTA